jgi:phosphate transport system substrate-binding protein
VYKKQININSMKKIIFISLSLLLMTNMNILAKDDLKGEISISGAFALYPMAVKWAEEFKKLHPLVKIDISAGGAGKGITDALAKMVDIGLVSREVNPEELKKGAYPIAVTKDAVLPVINASNPVLKEVLAKGLKKDVADNIWISGKIKTWGQAFGIKSSAAIHAYTRSDACGAAEVWAKFFGRKQEDLLGVGVFGDPGLATAVKKDPLGIGFNNIAYIYDSKTKKQNPGIRVIPLDLNNNGKIDPEENFYTNLDEIVQAIGDGKYPAPPARDLYFVTSGKPQKKVLVEFIHWVLTDGQKFVHESGYINLSKDRLKKESEKLN